MSCQKTSCARERSGQTPTISFPSGCAQKRIVRVVQKYIPSATPILCVPRAVYCKFCLGAQLEPAEIVAVFAKYSCFLDMRTSGEHDVRDNVFMNIYSTVLYKNKNIFKKKIEQTGPGLYQIEDNSRLHN